MKLTKLLLAVAAVLLWTATPMLAQETGKKAAAPEPAKKAETPEPAKKAPAAKPAEAKAEKPAEYEPKITQTKSERYFRSPTLLDDADPQPTGTMDFRLRTEYMTQSSVGHKSTDLDGQNGKHGQTGDDDIGMGFKWVWGPCKNVEVSLDLPLNLGDGGKTGDGLDGNADLTYGMLYNFWQEEDWLPAFSLGGKLRMPTGDSSSGVDAELRGILTKTIVGDLRGHANAFATTVNGNNDPDARPFQWGFVFGVDTPLFDCKDLLLILDYMHRSSVHEGVSNMNIFEASISYTIAEGHAVHFVTDVGLDDNDDTPNWGAKIAYTYELRYK